jgi:very-short-patch-repair endonuclease
LILPGTGRGTTPRERRGGGASPRVPPIVETARKLRRQMSYPEVLLWQRLRGAPMGIRFRRNHPIGLDYSADFYCASAKLVIEVDGQIHDQPRVVAGDAMRDAFLRQRGLTVLRVPAQDVLRNADETAAAIVALAAEPLHHRPAAGGPPPPQAGGG